MSGLEFTEPGWVHLLWVVFGFVLMLGWLERRGGGALGRFIALRRHSRLVNRASTTKRLLRLSFLGLTGVFLTVALMRPQWGMEIVHTVRSGAEIMVCLDVSNSMLSEDVAPNRLDRAKAEIRDLLAYLDGDQVGLIAFAGRATVLSPLTEDFGYLRLSLDSARASSVSLGGTRLEEPIATAIRGFGDSGDVSRSILLITDGEDHDSFPLEATKAAAERGVRILAIGFGDEAGSEIRITDPKTGARSVMRDGEGAVVISRLDGDLLREIALLTDGAYVPAGTGVLDLESIYQRHIAPLTRGKLDGRARRLKNDAFQWAVLLGILSLLGAVASGVVSRQAPGSGGTGLILLLAIVLANMGLFQSTSVDANDSIAPADNLNQAASVPSAVDTQDISRIEIPDDPRDAYNVGTKKLDNGEVEHAIALLTAARDQARTDMQVKYRATYNLGWAEVQQADALVDTDPTEALVSLGRAIDWFQESVNLRPSEEDARYNLETVMRRVIELEDYLAERSETDLQGKLEGFIDRQRVFLRALGNTVQMSPEPARATRGEFRQLAQQELVLLGDADRLNQQVVAEVESIKAKSEDELTLADRVRLAQLEAVLHHLHLARERLAQTRTRLRRLQGLRAYRRGSGALESVKQARDQLLDPVARLDGLVADTRQLVELTGTSMLAHHGLTLPSETGPVLPAWVTQAYLSDTQASLHTRTEELHTGLEAGLMADESEQEAQFKDDGLPVDKDRKAFLSSLRGATPLLSKASDAFLRAGDLLALKRNQAAVGAQSDGLRHLMLAREFFVGIKAMIELVYVSEKDIASLLEESVTAPHETSEEIASLASTLHSQNMNRMIRLGDMLSGAANDAGKVTTDSTAPATQAAARDKRLYETGYELWMDATNAMRALDELMAPLTDENNQVSTPLHSEEESNASKAAAEQAMAHLGILRQWFFSPVEHLRELAKRQIELNDETQTLTVLSREERSEAESSEVSVLAPNQSKIKTMAQSVAEGLEQHSQSSSLSHENTDAQSPPSDRRTVIEEAASLVNAAADNMGLAVSALEEEPRMLDEATKNQNKALQKLIQAIALFEDPESQAESDADSSSGDENKAEQAQGQAGNQPSSESNIGQLLQGVRDREARRRRDQSRGSSIAQSTVEKDW